MLSDQPGQKNNKKGKKNKKGGEEQEPEHKCNVCGEVFPSRNKVM